MALDGLLGAIKPAGSPATATSQEVLMPRLQLRRGAAIVVTSAAVLAAVLLSAGSASAAAWPDGPWSGAGTGTTMVTADGTTSDPVFDYSVNGRSGSWTFSNTAKTARVQPITWRYKGYHAWNQVTVKIEQFVIHAGQEYAKTLRGAGPVDCCAAPSGGFDYTYTTKFNLRAGDVYGFRMSGSNFDSDQRLIGTLSLGIPGDFSISANPSPLVAYQGARAQRTISTAVTNGATQPISLSVSGLPAGATASFSPPSMMAGGTSTLTVATEPTTQCGTYPLRITATGFPMGYYTRYTKYIRLQLEVTGACAPLVNGNFEDGIDPWEQPWDRDRLFPGWVALDAWVARTFAETNYPFTAGRHAATFGGQQASDATVAQPGTASVTQRFRPPTGTGLRLAFNTWCRDGVTYDWADVTLEDESAGTTRTMLHACTVHKGYLYAPITAGHLYKLTLRNHNDGWGNRSGTLYDDVEVLD
jgi:hypothetical protein